MKYPLHPFFFAIFPIFALYAHNIDKVQPSLLVRPLVVSLVAVCILFFILKPICRDWKKAAVVCSTFVILFFLYGHVTSDTSPMEFWIFTIAQSIVILGVFILVLGITIFLIVTSRNDFHVATLILNLIGVVLIMFSVAQIAIYEIFESEASRENIPYEGIHVVEERREMREIPDIYYIVLDAHARRDILQEIYRYDNTWFIEGLREQGFYIAEQSTSNYPQTYESIASTLNLRYINDLASLVESDSQDRRPLKELLDNNYTVAFLKDKGYQIVAFASGWTGVDALSNIDVYMQGRMNVGEFENILIETTPLAVLLGKDVQYILHRNRILYTLEHLKDIASIDSPTFTYVHLMLPHPPFVFDEDGGKIAHDVQFSLADSTWKLFGERTVDDYIKFYRAQVAYTDKRVLEIVRQLLTSSSRPPIIILQSDHGPGAFLEWKNPTEVALKERFSILNAYYFPDKEAYEFLYESITPVNSFRIVLNEYFGADYELLEDKNYFASWWTPYQFVDVTEKVSIDE